MELVLTEFGNLPGLTKLQVSG